ncbi:hypothetical protein E2C01_077338 [Portunus trituberculatus]|uniref:Secreted protein n=1 Tax=Portunus trituberculatus TaxID=210409 RepID=A0A5B7IE60_PORTR|nr:hypothetical protein [Portunus trituberculatus]
MRPPVGRGPNGRPVGCLRLLATIAVVWRAGLGGRCRRSLISLRGFAKCSQGLAAGPSPLRGAHLNATRCGCSGLLFW